MFMQLRDLDLMETVALGLLISAIILVSSFVIYWRTIG